MLPASSSVQTSVQTGGSLWGMERLPLYDAAVRTNHDLVNAAVECKFSLVGTICEKHDTTLNIVVSQGWPQTVCRVFNLSTELFLRLNVFFSVN